MRNAVAGGETVSKLRHPSFIYAFLLVETSFQRIQHRNKLVNLRPVQFVSNVLTNRVCQTGLALVGEIRTTILWHGIPLQTLFADFATSGSKP